MVPDKGHGRAEGDPRKDERSDFGDAPAALVFVIQSIRLEGEVVLMMHASQPSESHALRAVPVGFSCTANTVILRQYAPARFSTG